MNDELTSKEALFALDTTMEEDMMEYGREVTLLTIKHINSTPKLYDFVKENSEHGLSIKDSATTWAGIHNDEFGELLAPELDMVDWKEVERRV